jgi:hypothetical protein
MSEDSVLLKTYSSRQEAEFAQQFLKSSDILSRMADDDGGGWSPHVGAAAGFSLFVLQSDFERAKALIDEDVSAETDPAASE